jgi:hypothetical protein
MNQDKPLADRVLLQIFEYIPEYALLICKDHKYIVLPSFLNSHLRREHDFNTKACKSIQQAFFQLRRRTTAQLKHYIDPKNEGTSFHRLLQHSPIAPLPHIQVHLDGRLCQAINSDGLACRYVCRSLQRMQYHHRTQHGWINPQRQGRPSVSDLKKPNCKPWLEKVPCQQPYGLGNMRFSVEVILDTDSILCMLEDSLENFYRSNRLIFSTYCFYNHSNTW